MTLSAYADLRLLGLTGSRYRTVLFVFFVLSILSFVFDGLSIGMLVPLLAVMQDVETAGTLSGPIRWLAILPASVRAPWRIHALLGIIVGAVALKNGLALLGIRSGYRLGARMASELRKTMNRRCLAMDLEQFERLRPAEHLERALTHISELEVLARTAIEFVANVMTLAALGAVLFVLSWRLALLAVAFAGLSMLVGLIYARRMTHVGALENLASRAMTFSFTDMVNAFRLIRASSTEPRHAALIDHTVDAATTANYQRAIRSYAIHPITDIAATIALAAIVVAALWINGGDARLMLTRSLPFLFVLLRIVPMLKILNGQKAMIAAWLPCLHSVADYMRADARPTIHDGREEFAGLRREIQLRGITYTYPGRPKPALSSIDLVIPVGKMTAIIGESGAGKSTLINLLLRLYEPQSGEITIDGRPLPNLRLESYHRRIGSVAQDTFLFHQTVRYNVGYGAAEPPTEERVIEAAKRACIHNFIMELPDGYDTMVGDRGVRFSGGQRQRLALARAIVADPEILILDEATSSLDSETERAIQEALSAFGRGRTMIVIAHRHTTIRDADQVVVLKNGRVAEVRTARPQAV